MTSIVYKAQDFALPEGVTYMNGNSLGPLPKAVEARMQSAIKDEWGTGLIRSWNTAGWYDLPLKVGAKIAPMVGANPDEVICSDNVSINVFKLAAAALRMQPGRKVLLTEKGNFPTDGYMLAGLADLLGDDAELRMVDRADIEMAMDENVALLLLTHVHYVSAEILDMKSLTEKAQAKGILTLWDLSHSTGAVEVDLNGANADFAVGCGYKYLNGGPGAPAFAFVANRHLANTKQPLTGWFSHANPFAMSDDYAPSDTMRKMLTGTSGVLGMRALDTALDVWDGVDIRAIRQRSQELSELFIQLVDDELSDYGFALISPRETDKRGSHVSLSHENGYPIMQALISEGIIGDFRAPNYVRFAITPLYQNEDDIRYVVNRLKNIMESESWKAPEFAAANKVT